MFPLVFMDSVHFLINSLDNLIKNLGENDFYLLNQEFNVDLLDLLKQKGFFLMTTRTALKKSKMAYLAKINFFMHWLVLHLAIKIMSMFLTFGKFSKWNSETLSWFLLKSWCFIIDVYVSNF